jgi:ParB family transcriptional regulator, chromosome partitioning protein
MSAARVKRSSPILGAASAMIDHASERLVTKSTRFHHSFEADVNAIEPDPVQPRKVFVESEIASLAATMQERGQLQPILLRPNGSSKKQWIIVAGERRWRAAKLNGWPTILAIEHDGDPEITTLLENLQRIDLTPVEEARGLQHLIDGKGWTQDQAADALGKSKGEVSAILRILTLPDDLLTAVLTSELPVPKNALVELARVKDSSTKNRLIEMAKVGDLTVRLIRSARQDEILSANIAEEKSPSTKSTSKNSARTRFNFGRIDKITYQLRRVRLSGQRLVVRDRTVLEALRQEIDELLMIGD